mmetsp:Transcript_36317/g.88360  ORF Transcript_36317/g.88360 Transcript_36317/m.88360 type:complete len:266 (-) Transcript_36317:707-1504(-)
MPAGQLLRHAVTRVRFDHQQRQLRLNAFEAHQSENPLEHVGIASHWRAGVKRFVGDRAAREEAEKQVVARPRVILHRTAAAEVVDHPAGVRALEQLALEHAREQLVRVDREHLPPLFGLHLMRCQLLQLHARSAQLDVRGAVHAAGAVVAFVLVLDSAQLGHERGCRIRTHHAQLVDEVEGCRFVQVGRAQPHYLERRSVQKVGVLDGSLLRAWRRRADEAVQRRVQLCEQQLPVGGRQLTGRRLPLYGGFELALQRAECLEARH